MYNLQPVDLARFIEIPLENGVKEIRTQYIKSENGKHSACILGLMLIGKTGIATALKLVNENLIDLSSRKMAQLIGMDVQLAFDIEGLFHNKKLSAAEIAAFLREM